MNNILYKKTRRTQSEAGDITSALPVLFHALSHLKKGNQLLRVPNITSKISLLSHYILKMKKHSGKAVFIKEKILILEV
jgi:hypothetical protein